MDYVELGRRIRQAREKTSPSQDVIANQVSDNPEEYAEVAFEAYGMGQISLGKLAELLDIPLEAAKVELKFRNIPINLGVNSMEELLRDIENA